MDGSSTTLEEGLIGVPPVGTLQAVVGQSYVEVTAPSSLPEGYEFTVTAGNVTFPVKVPPGGVEEGQTFSVPMPAASNANAGTSIPVGHWRDGLDGLFNYGLTHPHCITACCCSIRTFVNCHRVALFALRGCAHTLFAFARRTTVAAGQVISRLQFTWMANPSRTAAASARAFAIIFYISVFHWVLIAALYMAVPSMDPNDYSLPKPESGWIKQKDWPEPEGSMLAFFVFFEIAKYSYAGLSIWLLYRLRKSVRSKYAIPGDSNSDFCWSFWCPCLVAGQMLRHTTDYDVYPGRLLSPTGLSKSAPSLV